MPDASTYGLFLAAALALLLVPGPAVLYVVTRSVGSQRGQRYVSGGIYLALGTAAAVSGAGRD